MPWLKENLFVSILALVTLVFCTSLVIFAKSGASRYQVAKEAFDSSYFQVKSLERISLYPSSSSRDAKAKSLADYRASISELQEEFVKYRAVKLAEISTQEFTTKLKKVRKKTVSELRAAGIESPDNFFLGFKDYRDKLANSNAVGVLSYQLDIVDHVISELVKSGPTELIRLYRDEVPEESGKTYTPDSDSISRNFGFEIVFKGSERSVREFLSSLGKTDPYYIVVRSIRISNETNSPPRIADAKFEVEDVEDSGTDEFFSSDESIESADGEANEAPEVPQLDSSRILAQVLGSEDVEVFVRFDATLFAEEANSLPEL